MNKKGFTLIELLVVISIVSLLSSVVYVNLQGARVKSQDTKKVVESQQLQKATGLYKEDKGVLMGAVGVTYRESEGSDFSDVLQPLVDEGYIGSVPDSPDDSYAYTNTGEMAVIESRLSGRAGYSIPTTCSGPIISAYERRGRISFTIPIEYQPDGSYDFKTYAVRDFDAETGEWTVASYIVGRCDGNYCYYPATSWDIEYNPETGECISPDGGIAGEEYPIGGDIGRSFCENITNMTKLAIVMTERGICQNAGSYCTCTQE